MPKENEKVLNPRKPTATHGSEKKEMEYIQMTSVIILADLDEQKITVCFGNFSCGSKVVFLGSFW